MRRKRSHLTIHIVVMSLGLLAKDDRVGSQGAASTPKTPASKSRISHWNLFTLIQLRTALDMQLELETKRTTGRLLQLDKWKSITPITVSSLQRHSSWHTLRWELSKLINSKALYHILTEASLCLSLCSHPTPEMMTPASAKNSIVCWDPSPSSGARAQIKLFVSLKHSKGVLLFSFRVALTGVTPFVP